MIRVERVVGVLPGLVDGGERFVVVGYRSRGGAILYQTALGFAVTREMAEVTAWRVVRGGENVFLVDRQLIEQEDRYARGLAPASPGYDG